MKEKCCSKLICFFKSNKMLRGKFSVACISRAAKFSGAHRDSLELDVHAASLSQGHARH